MKRPDLRIQGACEVCGHPASRLIWTRTERHRYCERCAEAWWDRWWALRELAA